MTIVRTSATHRVERDEIAKQAVFPLRRAKSRCYSFRRRRRHAARSFAFQGILADRNASTRPPSGEKFVSGVH